MLCYPALITRSHCLGRKLYSLPEMVSNMTAYCQLTDDVLMQVLRLESEDEEVREAKEIVRKIFSRELYPTVGNTLPLQPHGVVSALYLP